MATKEFKEIMQNLTDEYGMIVHDFESNKYKSKGGDNYFAEFITTLKIKGKGQRIDRTVIDLNTDSLDKSTLDDIPTFGLIGCIDSFGDLLDNDKIFKDIDVSKNPDIDKETKSSKKTGQELSEEVQKEATAEDNSTKDNSSSKEEKDLTKWTEENKKEYKPEVIRLRGNRKSLNIKSSKKMNKIVKKFSKSKMNPVDRELKTHEDIKPDNIKEFNNFIENVIKPHLEKKKQEKTG